jgi:hypothetical protein
MFLLEFMMGLLQRCLFILFQIYLQIGHVDQLSLFSQTMPIRLYYLFNLNQHGLVFDC